MKLYSTITIKQHNDDFIVKEVPRLPLSFSTEYTDQKFTILYVKKSGYTTFEVIDILSAALDIPKADINCLGLKDEDGITEQSISVKKILKPEDQSLLNSKKHSGPNFIKYAIHGYADDALAEKQLHGNIFQVLIRGLSRKQANKLYSSVVSDRQHTFINYYDQQRFGLPHGPFLTHEIGKALVLNDQKKASKLYVKSGNYLLDGYKKEEVDINIFNQLNPKKIDFFVSAYTSHLWNNAVAKEVYQSDCRQITIFDGYMLPVCAERLFAEEFTINGYEYKDNAVKEYKKTRQLKVSTNVYVDVPYLDYDDQYCMWVEFFLPVGCYATMALKQLVVSRLS